MRTPQLIPTSGVTTEARMVGNWAVCILLECFLLRAVGELVSRWCIFYLSLCFGDTLQHPGDLAERPVGFHEAVEVDNRLVRQRQTAQSRLNLELLLLLSLSIKIVFKYLILYIKQMRL